MAEAAGTRLEPVPSDTVQTEWETSTDAEALEWVLTCCSQTSLEVFLKHIAVMLTDVVWWSIVVIGVQLDEVILEVFSNPKRSAFFLPPTHLWDITAAADFSTETSVVSLWESCPWGSRFTSQLTSTAHWIRVLSAQILAGHVQRTYYGKDLELFRERNWFQMMSCFGFIVFFRQWIKYCFLHTRGLEAMSL